MTLPPSPHNPPDVKSLATATTHRYAGRHRRRSRWTWPRMLERIMGGWAPTLRMAAVLMTVLIAGLACILAVWGTFGLAFVVLLCALLHQIMVRSNRPLPI